MKICIVGTVCAPIPRIAYGGIEEYVFQISKELTKLGCEVDVVTVGFNQNKMTKMVEGFHIHELASVSISTARLSARALKRIMFGYQTSTFIKRESGFDVIHLNTGYAGWKIMLQRPRSPIVFTAHNWYPWLARWSSVGKHGLFERICLDMDDLLSLFVAKKSDIIIAISSLIAKGLIEKGVSETRVRVILNSVDTGKFYPRLKEKEFFLRKYNIPDNKTLFLFLGMLRIEKGVDYLIKAFKELLKRHDNVFLIIAGEGPHRTYLENLSRALKIDRSVKFLGLINEEHLPIVYSACDVYVLPSVLEPFGLTVLEAMASGKPVIVTDAPGKDVIEHGKQGFLVPPRDPYRICEAMSKCLDPLLREQMGAAALIKSKTYGWKENAKQLLKIYDELI